jgi:hypothetical protein
MTDVKFDDCWMMIFKLILRYFEAFELFRTFVFQVLELYITLAGVVGSVRQRGPSKFISQTFRLLMIAVILGGYICVPVTYNVLRLVSLFNTSSDFHGIPDLLSRIV